MMVVDRRKGTGTGTGSRTGAGTGTGAEDIGNTINVIYILVICCLRTRGQQSLLLHVIYYAISIALGPVRIMKLLIRLRLLSNWKRLKAD